MARLLGLFNGAHRVQKLSPERILSKTGFEPGRPDLKSEKHFQVTKLQRKLYPNFKV
jgi:hypothetical protein